MADLQFFCVLADNVTTETLSDVFGLIKNQLSPPVAAVLPPAPPAQEIETGANSGALPSDAPRASGAAAQPAAPSIEEDAVRRMRTAISQLRRGTKMIEPPPPAPPRVEKPKANRGGEKYLTVDERPELGAITVAAAAKLLGANEAYIRSTLAPFAQKKNYAIKGVHIHPVNDPSPATASPVAPSRGSRQAAQSNDEAASAEMEKRRRQRDAVKFVECRHCGFQPPPGHGTSKPCPKCNQTAWEDV